MNGVVETIVVEGDGWREETRVKYGEFISKRVVNVDKIGFIMKSRK